jgi:hypothetical protein
VCLAFLFGIISFIPKNEGIWGGGKLNRPFCIPPKIPNVKSRLIIISSLFGSLLGVALPFPCFEPRASKHCRTEQRFIKALKQKELLSKKPIAFFRNYLHFSFIPLPLKRIYSGSQIRQKFINCYSLLLAFGLNTMVVQQIWLA